MKITVKKLSELHKPAQHPPAFREAVDRVHPQH